MRNALQGNDVSELKAIDVHAHLFPPSAQLAARRGSEWFGSMMELTSDGKPVLVTGSRRRTIAAPGHMQDLATRVADMDRLGVDLQVISLLPPLMGYDLNREHAAERARGVNDEIASLISSYPGRFLALATLPLADPDAASEELNRVLKLPGFVGVEVGTHVADLGWDDERLFPVLAMAEELGAFVFIHPADVRRGGSIFDRYYLHNGVGNPLETTTTAASLIFGGVLDRLANLQVCLAHGGGYLALAAPRLDRVWTERSEARGTSQATPSTYLKRFFVDSLVHGDVALRFLLDTFGSNRVVLGSDYPADMGHPDPVRQVERNTLLSDQEQSRVLSGNLASALGLG